MNRAAAGRRHNLSRGASRGLTRVRRSTTLAVAGLAIALCAHAAPASASAAAPSRVLVEATEFRFTLSRTTVKAGPAIVQLAIRGEDPHDLRLVPAGKVRSSAQPATIPETLPGAVAEWRGKLTKGRWTLYCSLPGHRAAGMRAALTVR
jgi:plastocyanin